MTIGFVGLDHLGVVSSITAASKGYSILAYDPRPEVIQELKDLKIPFYEPGLEHTLVKYKLHMSFTNNIEHLRNCNILFISPDTPTNEDNKSDYNVLFDLLHIVVTNIPLEDKTIVITSQLAPGITRKISQIFNDNEVFYQPEILIIGDSSNRSTYPEQIIVGCREFVRLALPEQYHKYLRSFNCPISIMSYESAEMAKIAINVYLASQVTTTNTLSEICNYVGANWWHIQSVLKRDKRIGDYTTPGLGLSGGHLERDLVTIKQYAHTGLITNILSNSWSRRKWAFNIIWHRDAIKKDYKIAIWGLTYKELTSYTKNSVSEEIIKDIKELKSYIRFPDIQLKVYDPKATCEFSVSSSGKALLDSDILLILTPWDEFAWEIKDIATFMRTGLDEYEQKEKVIIDPYGVLDGSEARNQGFKYYSLVNNYV